MAGEAQAVASASRMASMVDERVKVEVELVTDEERWSTFLRLSSTDPRAGDPEVQAEMWRAGREIMRRMKLVPLVER